MYQAGQPVSQVDKRAVRLDALDGSLSYQAHFHVGNSGLSLFPCLFTQNISGGQDQTVFGSVQINHLHLNLPVQVFVEIFHIAERQFGGGDKTADALHIRDDTGVHHALYRHIQNGLVLHVLIQLLPGQIVSSFHP